MGRVEIKLTYLYQKPFLPLRFFWVIGFLMALKRFELTKLPFFVYQNYSLDISENMKIKQNVRREYVKLVTNDGMLYSVLGSC